MLTEMQNPASPSTTTNPSSRPHTPTKLDLESGSNTNAERKTVAVNRNCESLRYLIRHLSALRSEVPLALDHTLVSPEDQQET